MAAHDLTRQAKQPGGKEPTMNYIYRLEDELKEIRSEFTGLKCGISDLVKYLQSSKFHNDTTVQIDDVIRRIEEARKLSERLAVDQRDYSQRMRLSPRSNERIV